MGAVLPSGWEREPLGVFTKIASGCSPSQMGLADAGSYPFFKVEELNYSDKYLSRARAYYSKIGDSLQGKFLLLPKRGAAIFLNKLRIYEGTFQVDTNLMALGFDERKTFAEFMFYKLTTEGLDKIADTSSVPQINNKHIQPYIVDLPPLPEQKKIARILSTVDSKLALIDQQITATQTLKKGLMQKLFSEGVGTQDADGKWQPHTEFKDSELGKIPVGWGVKSISEITKWSSGGTPSKNNPKYWNGSIPWISATSMRGRYYSDSELKITEQAVAHGAKIAVSNSLLLLVRGSMLWNKIPVGLTTRSVAFNQDVKCITPFKQFVVSKFLFYWFSANEYHLMSMVTGTGIGAGKLETSELQCLEIKLPPVPEQQEIAKILSTADRKLDGLTTQKTQIEQLKKGLMQKLLTGQIRVKPDPQDHIQE